MEKLKAWLDAHLIDDWRKAWADLASVRFGTYAGTLAAVWAGLDDQQRSSILGLIGVDIKWLVPIGCAVAVYLRLRRKDDHE